MCGTARVAGFCLKNGIGRNLYANAIEDSAVRVAELSNCICIIVISVSVNPSKSLNRFYEENVQ